MPQKFNSLMHSRNVFKQKPDFEHLSRLYPSFAKHIIRFKNGKLTIDFTNADSLRSLTQTLLKHYFDLVVEIPTNRMIPAVPQRLNYVLWIEDLLALNELNSKPVKAIDLGTGACCIFPLLATRNNKNWSFIATECDPVSLEFAQRNVQINDLQNRILGKFILFIFKVYPLIIFLIVIPSHQHSLISHLCDSGDEFDFLMCNPPFFDTKFDDHQYSDEESDEREYNSSLAPSSSNTSSEMESVTEGGEIAFVKKLIEESLILRDRVKLYTVMLGRKQSLITLKTEIKNYFPHLIVNFKSTQFFQGKKIRWGLVWTFISDFCLEVGVESKHIKTKSKILSHEFKNLKITKYEFQSLFESIKSLLENDLQIYDFVVVREEPDFVELIIKSHFNTWSHQRRKRRIKTKNQSSDFEMICEDEKNDLHHIANKRKLDSSDDSICSFDEKETQKKIKDVNSASISKDEESYLLNCNLRLRKVKKSIVLEMQTNEKSKNKETTFQLFQFFKNKLV
ncbi:methyltransferase-like protein 2 [Dinothrombium tinctorium]|uniref:U6 small nuclear RNA (adenine-(43)-N(6))-methyltransferase n=1 Tax=Dinothrombium tinctorium TaxID=1965070 RepID=A0A3S3SN00_9ACAR|nr:methyltransferase-like protein 2 [Dinothrombium tinctorium]